MRLDKRLYHPVLMLKGETTARTEVAELHAITDESDALVVGFLVFLLGIVMLKFALQFVHQF